MPWVAIPVKTTLRQNRRDVVHSLSLLQYQSKRRCAKTVESGATTTTCCNTSQNDAAPKLVLSCKYQLYSCNTSQNDAAPKLAYALFQNGFCCNTSQNDAAPKRRGRDTEPYRVAIPVKTTLRQNHVIANSVYLELQYQSKRRCAKTMAFSALASILLQYQSKRRCAKTGRSVSPASKRLQYQSKRRCAKTILSRAERSAPLQYQSKRRCAKTRGSLFASYYCCNTSQNDAAPKPYQQGKGRDEPLRFVLLLQYQSKRRCAKTAISILAVATCCNTSQNDAAPKRCC